MRPGDSYNPIAGYALIGDTRTAALVSRDGSIDWYCCPRFDSPAVFCRLLDADKGGFFGLSPHEPYAASRRYLDDTNVLSTTFRVAGGVARLVDFMPLAAGASTRGSRILRLLEGAEGSVRFHLDFRPTFDYARRRPAFEKTEGGVVARSESEALFLGSPADLEINGDRVTGSIDVREGERLWLTLEWLEPDQNGSAILEQDCEEELAATIAYWQNWLSGCSYAGPYASLVRRSALVLRLLTYSPTGALIAAPTTSLPEAIGGVRNWDYRLTWLRDASLTLDALMRLGFHNEAMAFFDWLESLCIQCRGRLQIVYSVDGSENVDEHSLDHLSGYAGSRPVRVGNAAAKQTQLDVFGHVLDAVHFCATHMRPPHPPLWSVLSFLADEAAELWKEPDHGMWEVRRPPQHNVYSKLMCWVALDRALRLAESTGLEGNRDLWRKARDEVRNTIESRGYNEGQLAFVQTLDGDELDASLLALPLMEFLPANDQRVVSTVQRIKEDLSRDGLVRRYRTGDGLPGTEATFLPCTFWLVENLALQGEVREAREWFEGAVSYANDLGLLSEEADPQSHLLLGNYPQAFTHLGLIRAALRIAEAEQSARANGPLGGKRDNAS